MAGGASFETTIFRYGLSIDLPAMRTSLSADRSGAYASQEAGEIRDGCRAQPRYGHLSTATTTIGMRRYRR